MARGFPGGLFWRIYPLLLASVALVAILGAVVWHLFGIAPMMAGMRMQPHVMRVHFATSLVLLLLVAMVIGLAAFPVTARITGRLESLRRSVEAWGGGDHARRAAVHGTDEIAAVAASFNAAADRADALLSAHKSMLAHASHELRSPLARLALAAELAAGGGDIKATTAVRREIAELDALVEEILLASQLDHGADTEIYERVDCLALAAEEAARVGVVVREVPSGGPAFDVRGSSRLLRRLIRNLLDNALKHGGPPVQIALDHVVSDGEASICIAVRDHGPGIAPDLVEHVFEPFFRPPGRAEASGSWGLGLALVRQIAQRHEGQVTCLIGDDQTTTFAVELPVRRA